MRFHLNGKIVGFSLQSWMLEQWQAISPGGGGGGTAKDAVHAQESLHAGESLCNKK